MPHIPAAARRRVFSRQRKPADPHNEWRPRTMSVGVDAALSPAVRNCRIARTIGENEKCPVGADASVRPLGNCGFAATCRKNERAPCRSMRRPQASFEAQPRAARLLAPKMGIDPYKRCADLHWCIRFCRCVLPGGQRRPPLRVRACSHRCTEIYYVVPRGRGRTPPLRKIITSSRSSILLRPAAF